METYDVVVIGAGLSGINCAYRLQSETPVTSFTVFEGRDELGGIWDLFKFPGVRSDSDLPSLGFAWHPWPCEQVFAEGTLIMEYIKDRRGEAPNRKNTFSSNRRSSRPTGPPRLRSGNLKWLCRDKRGPQFWPEQYDYSGQKLAVVGSGATAVTLLPRLAQQAAEVDLNLHDRQPGRGRLSTPVPFT